MSQQTELHRHLDVALRLPTLLELAQERGLEGQSTSVDAFREKIVFTEPFGDLASVLAKFTLFQHVLDRPDILERVGFEAVEDCYREGTRAVELRWSPSFVCELSHLPWEDALDGFEAGIRKALAKYSDVKAGMICIASRDYGDQVAEQTIDFYLQNRERFVGIDLAGNETDYPSRMFEKAFQKAHDQGARITVHAGEGAGPESIWEAVELLGAHRIGHGIACVQDPQLMEHLAKNQICLEMCPTSNWITQCVTNLREHPLPHVLRAGIPVCINTDDPAVFGVDLPHEIQVCRKIMGLSEAELQRCQDHAARASFL